MRRLTSRSRHWRDIAAFWPVNVSRLPPQRSRPQQLENIDQNAGLRQPMFHRTRARAKLTMHGRLKTEFGVDVAWNIFRDFFGGLPSRGGKRWIKVRVDLAVAGTAIEISHSRISHPCVGSRLATRIRNELFQCISNEQVIGSASLFVLDFHRWRLRHNLEDEEDNEIRLRAWDYRARRGVPREQLGRLGGGQGNSIVSRLRGSFQVAAQLAGTTTAGASNPRRPGDAGDSLGSLEMPQRAVCSKDIRRNVGNRAAVRPENTASWRTRSSVPPCRRRPCQRTVADALGNACQRQRHPAAIEEPYPETA